MAVSKYNWHEIKQNFMKSEHQEVQAFLGTDMGLPEKKRNLSYWKLQTKGWTKEKEEMAKNQTEQAIAKLEKDKNVILANKNILNAIKNIESKVATLIGSKKSFTVDELPKVKVGWEMLRVSQNLPTTYSKNESNNQFLGKDGNPIDPFSDRPSVILNIT